MQYIPLILSLIFFIMPAHAFDLSQKLAECETHFKANRLTTGEGGTALACYEAVLKQDPTNSEARRGLDQIKARYQSRMNRANRRGQQYKVPDYQRRIGLVDDVKNSRQAIQASLRQEEELEKTRLQACRDLHDGLDAYAANDFKCAIRILLPYAQNGDGMAQYCVARMYENGWGITKNNDEAIKWYKKAAKQGHNIAKTILRSKGLGEKSNKSVSSGTYSSSGINNVGSSSSSGINNVGSSSRSNSSLDMSKPVHVKAYYRKDGTYVRSHTRSRPINNVGSSSSSGINNVGSYSRSKSSLDMSKPVHVKAYYRKDGTYVRSHTRSRPNK